MDIVRSRRNGPQLSTRHDDDDDDDESCFYRQLCREQHALLSCHLASGICDQRSLISSPSFTARY